MFVRLENILAPQDVIFPKFTDIFPPPGPNTEKKLKRQKSWRSAIVEQSSQLGMQLLVPLAYHCFAHYAN